MFDAQTLEGAIARLGALLADRGHTYEVVAIGGGGLLLVGHTVRPTKDLDLLAIVEASEYQSAKPLPAPLAEAIADVALLLGLPGDWLNSGPTSQLRFGLPEGFRERTVRRVYGGLTINFASRLDQICLKLYAAVDDSPRGKHFADLQTLAPSAEEIAFAASWVKTQDAAEEFPDLVDQVVERLTGGSGATE